ncbi:MAG TPA: hypothetical protein VFQ10_10255 [Rubrobacter sp.]|nr:hypothetical protein [Rubrobacter sp.]
MLATLGPKIIAGTAYGAAICTCCGVAENPPGPSPTAKSMPPHEMANARAK